jgi:hypothetical protein
MGRRLEHPRTILAVRIVLYLGLVVVLGTLAVGLVGYLFVVAAVGGIALLADIGPGALPLAGLTVGGLGIATLVGVGAAIAVRWAERRIVAADRRPDPVEDLTERYVAAEMDEIEFERQLEAVLTGESAVDDVESTSWVGRDRRGNNVLSSEGNCISDGANRRNDP